MANNDPFAVLEQQPTQDPFALLETPQKSISSAKDLVDNGESDANFFDRVGVFAKESAFMLKPELRVAEAAYEAREPLTKAAKEIGLGFTRGGLSMPETVGQNMNFIGRSLRVNKKNIDMLSKTGIISPFKAEMASKISDKLIEYGEKTIKHWQGEQEFLSKFKDKETWEGTFSENPNAIRIFASAAEAIPMMAVGVAGGVAANSSWAGAMILGSAEGLGVFQEAVEKGKPDVQAIAAGVTAGALSATVEGKLNMMGFGVLEDMINPKVARHFLTQFSLNAVEEGVQEGLQTFTTNLVRKYGIDRAVDIQEGLVESIVVGAVTGGAMTGFSSSPDRKSAVQELTPEEQTEGLKLLSEVMNANGQELDTALTQNLEENNLAIEGSLERAAYEERAKTAAIPGKLTDLVAEEEIKAISKVSKAMLAQAKLGKMEAKAVEAQAAKETLEDLQGVKNIFAKSIAMAEGTEGEYAELPRAYKAKEGMTYDQVATRLQELGIEINGDASSVTAFFQGLEVSIGNMRVQAGENVVAEIEAKIQDIHNKYTKEAAITRQEIGAYQADLIDTIKSLPIDAEYKARFLTNVKNANTYQQLYKQTQAVLERSKTFASTMLKSQFDKQINKELKTTKDVKKGTKRVGRYDYETTKLFEDIRRINNMKRYGNKERTIANPEIQAERDKIGVPQNEMDMMKLRLLELKENGKSSSVQMYRQVYEDILQAKRIGEGAKDLNDFNAKIARLWNVDEALDSIGKVRANKDTIKTKIGNLYRKGFTNIGSMLNAIAGKDFSDKYDPELFENRRETAKWEMTQEISEAAADILGVEKKKVLYTLTEMGQEQYTIIDFDDLRRDLSKLDLLDIYNAIKNGKTRDDYFRAYGEQQITELLSNVTEQEAQLADYMQFVAQSYYTVFNDRSIRLRNKDLGRVDNYWPATSEHVQDAYDDIRMQGETASAEKERVRGAVIPVPTNAWLKLNKHIAQGEHIRHVSDKYAELKRMFDNRKVKNAIETKFGKDIYRTLNNQLDRLSLNAQTQQLDAISNWIGIGLNNWVTAKIALSPSVFAKQLISQFNYIENMDGAEWTKYYIEGLKNPKQTLDYMMKVAPFLKARYGRGYSEAITRALNEAEKISPARHNWADAMSSLVRMGDIGAIIYGGYPMLKSQIDAGVSEDVAVANFEKATLKAQQSGLASGLSEWQNSRNPVARLFLAFKNTANQYFRKQADAVIQYQNGDITAKQLAKTLAIYGAIQPTLYALVGMAVRGALYGSDDDDYFSEILQTIALSPFNALPIINDMMNYTARKQAGEKAWKVFSIPMLDELGTAWQKLHKEDVDVYEVLGALGTLLEPVTGAPINTYSRIVKNIIEPKKRNRRRR